MFVAHLRRTIVIILTCSLFIGIFDAAAQDTPGINDAPVNSLPASVNTEPNTPVAIAASVSDADVGAGNMEIELNVSGVGGSVTCGGTFSWGAGTNVTSDVLVDTLVDVNTALSTLVFTPQAGCAGMARMVLETDDQGNTWVTPCPHLPANPENCILADTNFVNINIAAAGDSDPANNAPVNFLPGSIDIGVNTPTAIPASVTDLDVGGGNMEVELNVSGVGGSVTCSGSFTWGGGTNVQSDTMVASLASINAALSSLVFTPQAGCVGMARLVLETDDQGNSWETPCPHLPANPENCILADTDFININILAVLPTATNTATSTNTTVPNTATNTNTATATETLVANTATNTATATETPVANTATNTATSTETAVPGTATATATATETAVPGTATATATATNTLDPVVTAVPSSTLYATLTLTPVAERCLYYIPNGAVQGRMISTVRAFFAPNLQSETPDVVIPGGSTWYIVGASNGFYQLFIACPGNLVWVPASSMIPNYDEVWNGAPLPNAGG